MVAVVEVQERRCVPPAGFAPGRIEQENRRAHDVAADPAIAEPIPELVQRRYPTDRCVLEDHVASLRLRRIRKSSDVASADTSARPKVVVDGCRSKTTLSHVDVGSTCFDCRRLGTG